MPFQSQGFQLEWIVIVVVPLALRGVCPDIVGSVLSWRCGAPRRCRIWVSALGQLLSSAPPTFPIRGILRLGVLVGAGVLDS
jgi:hypothetical protein